MSSGGASSVFKNDVIMRSCPKAVSGGSNTTYECTIGKLVICLSQENGLHSIPSQISRMCSPKTKAIKQILQHVAQKTFQVVSKRCII